MIHKSHTKKDLIEIIEVFEFTDVIENYKDLNKDSLINLLDIHLRTIYDIKPKKLYYPCDDISDLRNYLKHPTPKQTLSIVEKDKLIEKAKKIIFYCRICSFTLGLNAGYNTIEEVISDAHEIRKYGDMPSIRRALNLLRSDGKINENIEPIMTYRTQQRLDRKDRLKNGALAKMQVQTGKFKVVFQ